MDLEPATREDANVIMEYLMRIDEKVTDVREYLLGENEDDEEEEEDEERS